MRSGHASPRGSSLSVHQWSSGNPLERVLGRCRAAVEKPEREIDSVRRFRLARSFYPKGGVCHANESQPVVR
ncbi:hypothetical protein PBY51_010994 [Eleginops maclovinus]|uniref:Uncharacterized protein n=1 Tax=Eleginops maclovinus TaxID=56733 RepID=A0AAN8AIX0_ELEMC|nr:hypothetical protein PBY51_010994 [Eleginops maclovinus]